MSLTSYLPDEDQMDALVWTAPFASELRRQAVPHPTDSEILLAVRAVGVCGSDLHGYRGSSPLRVPPYVLGHEVVGQDGNGNLHVVNPLAGCEDCALCAAGTPNLCPGRILLGLNRPGAFAEYVAVPAANTIPLPASMSPVLGTLAEPLAPGVNALRDVDIDGDTVVVVLGCGAIGLLAAHLARVRGAGLVICHDLDERRVAQAATLADVSNTSWEHIEAVVADSFDGLGAAIVIDAVGIEATWNRAVDILRPGGLLLEIGLGQAEGSIPMGDVVRRGLSVRGVYAYTPADFADALAILESEPPDLSWVETGSLSDGARTLAALASGDGPAKAVFTT